MLFSVSSFAQKYTLSGTVHDATTSEPVYLVTVVVKECEQWATTDLDGKYIIDNLNGGKYTVEVSSLGYETFTREIVLKGNIKVDISLNPSSIALDEVVVTAKEGGGMTSSSHIAKQTLEHIQPSSLTDVMQLLPGSITTNPSLTTVNSISIRDIGCNSANVVGTALIVDGATLSNDANIQMLASGNAMNNSTENAASSAGGSVDTRQISTDNIESVEVIRGIPSAEYGNMTSGAVLVKTKAGVTPWEFRIKTDPALKQVYAGKGFSLGNKAGVLNFDTDYALAYNDIRSVAEKYDRVNFQMGYSNTFHRRLTLNAKLRAHYSSASTASDPDLFLDEIAEETDKSISLNVNGKWTLNKKWITNVDYLFAGSYGTQYSRDRRYTAVGRIPGSSTMNEGENIGFFTPAQYYSDVQVFGTPVNAQGKLMASHFYKGESVTNKVILGAEYFMDGNLGRGKVFDVTLPPTPGIASYRERSYRDIPLVHKYTAFAEDKFKYSFGKQYVEMQAGLRYTGIYAEKIPNISDFTAIEPRLNLKLGLIHNGSVFKDLSARAGWGIATKAPSMIYLYPEPAYSDKVSFSYNDIDANDWSLAVMTTKKVETTTSSLKLQKSVNFETGIDFDTRLVSGSLVFFEENLSNGYGFATVYTPMEYKRYGYEWTGGTPSAQTIPSGQFPVYVDGNVLADGKPVSSITDTTFMKYSLPVNSINNYKWGIEYTLDFAKIKAINTSINVSGAYMNITTLNNAYSYYHYLSSVNNRAYPYVGIYPGGKESQNSSVKERFSTNVRFITHIPRLAMVVTLGAQMVFVNATTYRNVLSGDSLPYYYDEAGNRISGEAALADQAHTKHVNPQFIMDMAGNVYRFTEEMERDKTFENLIIDTNNSTYYLRSGYPCYGMLNLRLTKEIRDIATISFYANNFLNQRGRVANSVTGYLQDMNSKIYFGAEVKITVRQGGSR